MKFSYFKKKYFLLLLIPFLFIFTYWLKVQIGINLFNSVSISSYPPFKYLINNIISSPNPGILFEEDFEKKRIFKKWSKLWMREYGTASQESALDGMNGSKCLLIENNGHGSWVYSYRKRVKVKKGDIFYFEGFANIQVKDVSAYLSVAAFDKNNHVVAWNLYKEKVNRIGDWVRVHKEFSITDDHIRYLTFRLAGIGNGKYRFDDILFQKIK